MATLETFRDYLDLSLQEPGRPALTAGQRRCPNRSCHAHIFVVYEGAKVLASYPVERLDFDSSNLPRHVNEALEEAVTCHANGCYVAAGMLVRKTLEALCEDQGAKGKHLKDRIEDLRSQGKVILPQALLDGLDEVRLLGNDAAHIESRTYDQVGQEEVEVAIDFTKEVLKAVYQLQDLVSRFQAMKKGAPDKPVG